MEIIDRDDSSGDELVQVAFAETREEAALIRGLLREEGIRSLARQGALDGRSLGTGLLANSSRRIYVRPEQAARARELLGEVMVEDPAESEVPEPANAAYLADATGRPPRDYSFPGAFARTLLVAAAILAVAFLLFLLIH